MDINEFTTYADKVITEQIPQQLTKGLNLGIIIIPEAKIEGDYYIMGEYVTEEMGSHIVLYYGSFVELLDKEEREQWEEEIKDTIEHELQHHIEDLAGEEKLAEKEELEELREQLMKQRNENINKVNEQSNNRSESSSWLPKWFYYIINLFKR